MINKFNPPPKDNNKLKSRICLEAVRQGMILYQYWRKTPIKNNPFALSVYGSDITLEDTNSNNLISFEANSGTFMPSATRKRDDIICSFFKTPTTIGNLKFVFLLAKNVTDFFVPAGAAKEVKGKRGNKQYIIIGIDLLKEPDDLYSFLKNTIYHELVHHFHFISKLKDQYHHIDIDKTAKRMLPYRAKDKEILEVIQTCHDFLLPTEIQAYLQAAFKSSSIKTKADNFIERIAKPVHMIIQEFHDIDISAVLLYETLNAFFETSYGDNYMKRYWAEVGKTILYLILSLKNPRTDKINIVIKENLFYIFFLGYIQTARMIYGEDKINAILLRDKHVISKLISPLKEIIAVILPTKLSKALAKGALKEIKIMEITPEQQTRFILLSKALSQFAREFEKEYDLPNGCFSRSSYWPDHEKTIRDPVRILFWSKEKELKETFLDLSGYEEELFRQTYDPLNSPEMKVSFKVINTKPSVKTTKNEQARFDAIPGTRKDLQKVKRSINNNGRGIFNEMINIKVLNEATADADWKKVKITSGISKEDTDALKQNISIPESVSTLGLYIISIRKSGIPQAAIILGPRYDSAGEKALKEDGSVDIGIYDIAESSQMEPGTKQKIVGVINGMLFLRVDLRGRQVYHPLMTINHANYGDAIAGVKTSFIGKATSPKQWSGRRYTYDQGSDERTREYGKKIDIKLK